MRTYEQVERDGERDAVAIEEPLEIRVDGRPLSVTMRTPGHDEELALGFLHGEGLIDGPRPVGLTEDFAANTIEVTGPLLRDPGERRFYTTSSCGVCGKGALEEVAVASAPLPAGPTVERELLAALPERLEQPTFELTGGVHATGLFDAAGALLFAREDVGRHNAMDKVVGRALLDGLVPLADRILCVSGRLSFELVQKAAVAGAPILVGVGAPSTLAIELAADRGMTLCGFTRRGRTNVYTGAERVSRPERGRTCGPRCPEADPGVKGRRARRPKGRPAAAGSTALGGVDLAGELAELGGVAAGLAGGPAGERRGGALGVVGGGRRPVRAAPLPRPRSAARPRAARRTPAATLSRVISVIGGSAADRAHRPGRRAEAGLVDPVLQLLAPDRVADDPLQLGVVGAGPQRRAQVGLVEGEEAGAQLAVGGQAQPVAVGAERFGDGVDEADLAAPVGEGEDAGGRVRLARQLAQRVDLFDHRPHLGAGQHLLGASRRGRRRAA